MKTRKFNRMMLPLLFCAGAAMAQAPQSAIRESTDPAKIAEIERHAEALRRAQPTQAAPGMQRDMRDGHAHGHMHGHMHGGAKGQHPGKGGHHRGHHGMGHDHPKAAPGAGGTAR